MTLTVLSDWDAAAATLCAQGQKEGFAAFVIRATEDRRVRYIGPRLPPALVAKMLREAATEYESQVGTETLN